MNRKKSLEEWIKKANEKHNFKYDYSLITEIKSDRYQKVPIVCPEGHIFYMPIKEHIDRPSRKGNGCKYCSQPCFDTESFIRLSNEKHGNKYDYSKTIYVNQRTKVIIICPKHGEFIQKPSNHYHLMRGCPRCHESVGEITIRKWLQKNEIEFKKEHTFKGCKYIGRLKFDFYLPNYNICIEFDGLQHFKAVDKFGGNEEFEKIKSRDKAKNEWCEKNEIKLIRISYSDLNKIFDILNNVFKKLYK